MADWSSKKRRESKANAGDIEPIGTTLPLPTPPPPPPPHLIDRCRGDRDVTRGGGEGGGGGGRCRVVRGRRDTEARWQSPREARTSQADRLRP